MKYLFIECDLKKDSTIQVNDKKDINYIVNVLRFKKDQNVLLLDGNGNYSESILTSCHKKGVEIQTSDVNSVSKQDQLNLYFGMPNKLPKLELILKMGTEMGVTNFYPLNTSYSQVQSLGKIERLQQIIKSAASQSESKFLPKLHDIQKITDIKDQTLYVCVCRKDNPQITQIKEFKESNVLIGPEGGLSDADLEILSKNNKVNCVSLGKKILRLETASLLALGVVMLKKFQK